VVPFSFASFLLGRQKKMKEDLLKVGHSITDRFSIEALLPYVRQERNVMQPAGFDDFESTQGIGDLLILFKYRIRRHSWS